MGYLPGNFCWMLDHINCARELVNLGDQGSGVFQRAEALVAEILDRSLTQRTSAALQDLVQWGSVSYLHLVKLKEEETTSVKKTESHIFNMVDWTESLFI